MRSWYNPSRHKYTTTFCPHRHIAHSFNKIIWHLDYFIQIVHSNGFHLWVMFVFFPVPIQNIIFYSWVSIGVKEYLSIIKSVVYFFDFRKKLWRQTWRETFMLLPLSQAQLQIIKQEIFHRGVVRKSCNMCQSNSARVSVLLFLESFRWEDRYDKAVGHHLVGLV